MTTYVYDKDTDKVVPRHQRDAARGHYVISDTMDQRLLHPVTGRYYDSKSRFRADTRAAGCEEVGNEKMDVKPIPLDREKRREVIREQVRNMTDSQAGEILTRLERQFKR